MEKKKETNILLILTIVIVALIVMIVLGLYMLNQKTTQTNQVKNTESTQTLSESSVSSSLEAVTDQELTDIQTETTDLINTVDSALKESDSVDKNRDNAPTL